MNQKKNGVLPFSPFSLTHLIPKVLDFLLENCQTLIDRFIGLGLLLNRFVKTKQVKSPWI